MEITGIDEIRKRSFNVRYGEKNDPLKVAAQLANDYHEFFNQNTSFDGDTFLDENSEELCLTVKVTDGCPDEERGCLLDFIEVMFPKGVGDPSEFRIRQNQRWSDDNRFLEFHCELMDKYME
ncbi:MAG: hypothetical protein KAT77_00520 [Nanoarchaeota archaeon]|nr:hypothetical protein [Nanoarchaeota archaeon]